MAVGFPSLRVRVVSWGAAPVVAALGPGGLKPGIRRIGVPFGPMIVVARLPLRRTVPGGELQCSSA